MWGDREAATDASGVCGSEADKCTHAWVQSMVPLPGYQARHPADMVSTGNVSAVSVSLTVRVNPVSARQAAQLAWWYIGSK
jgi:hypothetical protein